jgi:nitroreductase
LDLAEAMQTQRAIRRLRPDPVDDEVLLRCLELATRAPSGGNQQGWEWIVIRDRDKKKALANQYRRAWSVYGGLGRRLYGGNAKTLRIIDAVQWQVDHFEEVPALVVPCLRGIGPPVPWIVRSSRYGSIYPAIQNFLLAARAEGLGAALTTLPLWNRISAHTILELPWNIEPVAVIPVGWPLGKYGPTTRRPIGEVVHVDRFGNRPFTAPRGNGDSQDLPGS